MEDRQTFDRIMGETDRSVCAYIAGLGVSLDTVDDLAQEVYLEFFQHMDAMPAGILPVRWLKGIARNVCMNHFRSSKRREEQRVEAVAEIMVQMEAEAAPAPETTDQGVALQSCLQKLTVRQRKIIGLRYEEGVAGEEVARRLGANAGAIRVTLFRLLRMLRDCVTETLKEVRT